MPQEEDVSFPRGRGSVVPHDAKKRKIGSEVEKDLFKVRVQ